MLRNIRNICKLRGVINSDTPKRVSRFVTTFAKGVAFRDPLRKKNTNNSDGHGRRLTPTKTKTKTKTIIKDNYDNKGQLYRGQFSKPAKQE